MARVRSWLTFAIAGAVLAGGIAGAAWTFLELRDPARLEATQIGVPGTGTSSQAVITSTMQTAGNAVIATMTEGSANREFGQAMLAAMVAKVPASPPTYDSARLQLVEAATRGHLLAVKDADLSGVSAKERTQLEGLAAGFMAGTFARIPASPNAEEILWTGTFADSHMEGALAAAGKAAQETAFAGAAVEAYSQAYGEIIVAWIATTGEDAHPAPAGNLLSSDAAWVSRLSGAGWAALPHAQTQEQLKILGTFSANAVLGGIAGIAEDFPSGVPAPALDALIAFGEGMVKGAGDRIKSAPGAVETVNAWSSWGWALARGLPGDLEDLDSNPTTSGLLALGAWAQGLVAGAIDNLDEVTQYPDDAAEQIGAIAAGVEGDATRYLATMTSLSDMRKSAIRSYAENATGGLSELTSPLEGHLALLTNWTEGVAGAVADLPPNPLQEDVERFSEFASRLSEKGTEHILALKGAALDTFPMGLVSAFERGLADGLAEASGRDTGLLPTEFGSLVEGLALGFLEDPTWGNALRDTNHNAQAAYAWAKGASGGSLNPFERIEQGADVINAELPFLFLVGKAIATPPLEYTDAWSKGVLTSSGDFADWGYAAGLQAAKHVVRMVENQPDPSKLPDVKDVERYVRGVVRAIDVDWWLDFKDGFPARTAEAAQAQRKAALDYLDIVLTPMDWFSPDPISNPPDEVDVSLAFVTGLSRHVNPDNLTKPGAVEMAKAVAKGLGKGLREGRQIVSHMSREQAEVVKAWAEGMGEKLFTAPTGPWAQWADETALWAEESIQAVLGATPPIAKEQIGATKRYAGALTEWALSVPDRLKGMGVPGSPYPAWIRATVNNTLENLPVEPEEAIDAVVEWHANFTQTVLSIPVDATRPWTDQQTAAVVAWSDGVQGAAGELARAIQEEIESREIDPERVKGAIDNYTSGVTTWLGTLPDLSPTNEQLVLLEAWASGVSAEAASRIPGYADRWTAATNALVSQIGNESEQVFGFPVTAAGLERVPQYAILEAYAQHVAETLFDFVERVTGGEPPGASLVNGRPKPGGFEKPSDVTGFVSGAISGLIGSILDLEPPVIDVHPVTDPGGEMWAAIVDEGLQALFDVGQATERWPPDPTESVPAFAKAVVENAVPSYLANRQGDTEAQLAWAQGVVRGGISRLENLSAAASERQIPLMLQWIEPLTTFDASWVPAPGGADPEVWGAYAEGLASAATNLSVAPTAAYVEAYKVWIEAVRDAAASFPADRVANEQNLKAWGERVMTGLLKDPPFPPPPPHPGSVPATAAFLHHFVEEGIWSLLPPPLPTPEHVWIEATAGDAIDTPCVPNVSNGPTTAQCRKIEEIAGSGFARALVELLQGRLPNGVAWPDGPGPKPKPFPTPGTGPGSGSGAPSEPGNSHRPAGAHDGVVRGLKKVQADFDRDRGVLEATTQGVFEGLFTPTTRLEPTGQARAIAEAVTRAVPEVVIPRVADAPAIPSPASGSYTEAARALAWSLAYRLQEIPAPQANPSEVYYEWAVGLAENALKDVEAPGKLPAAPELGKRLDQGVSSGLGSGGGGTGGSGGGGGSGGSGGSGSAGSPSVSLESAHAKLKGADLTGDPWVSAASPFTVWITPPPSTTEGTWRIGWSVGDGDPANEGTFAPLEKVSARYGYEFKPNAFADFPDGSRLRFVIARVDATGTAIFDRSGVPYAAQIDRAPPSVRFSSPEVSDKKVFRVAWLGDDGKGSGIDKYWIDYRMPGGSWNAWLVATTVTAADFTGANGVTYEFRARATDVAGHAPEMPSSALAATRVSLPPGTPDTNAKPKITLALPGTALAGTRPVEVSATDPDGSIPIANVVIVYDPSSTLVFEEPIYSGPSGSFSLDTRKLADGAYRLRATVFDGSDSETFETATFIVDNTPPVVRGVTSRAALVAGEPGLLVTVRALDAAKARLDVLASDAAARELMRDVRLVDDGTLGDAAAGDGVHTAFLRLKDGNYLLRVVVEDAAGNRASQSADAVLDTSRLAAPPTAPPGTTPPTLPTAPTSPPAPVTPTGETPPTAAPPTSPPETSPPNKEPPLPGAPRRKIPDLSAVGVAAALGALAAIAASIGGRRRK